MLRINQLNRYPISNIPLIRGTFRRNTGGIATVLLSETYRDFCTNSVTEWRVYEKGICIHVTSYIRKHIVITCRNPVNITITQKFKQMESFYLGVRNTNKFVVVIAL